MSKLMILGGSNCQKNALVAARKRGFETVLVDYYEHPPAAAYADVHVRASTFDVPACVAAAREHRVDGVFTLGTDQPVYTAACVAEALGLPSPIDPPTALAVTNKKVMKRVLADHGVPTARCRLLGRGSPPDALDGLAPPLVLKPLDSQGQRGVFKLGGSRAVFGRLEETLSWSRQDEALVEEFYPSAEITVSGWVRDGELYILAATDRLLYDDPTHIGVCVGHRFPTAHMARYPEIERISRAVRRAFGIRNGPLYIQLLAGADGILVNELACRIGGAFEDVFLPYLSGFDILGAVMDAALGRPADVSALEGYDPARCPRRAAVELLFCPPGRVLSATPLETLRALPGVLDAGYNYAPGDTVPPVENATARFGHCVLAGGNQAELDARLAEFRRVFRVETRE